MADAPPVSPGDWIIIGDQGVFRSVVCTIEPSGRVEVVYLDGRDRAINEDVIWTGARWAFAPDGPNGGEADGNPRLQRFIAKLRGRR